jgi:hypothetical protein
MNRLLTLTSGGLFATMAILPIGAFAQTGATATLDSKTPAPMSASAAKSDVKTPAPVTAQAEAPKAGTTETKTPAHESKAMNVTKHENKHGMSIETQKPTTHSSVQPKVTDQKKS